MSDPLLHSLQQHFGHESFRPGQREVVERLLAGKSALALFPTSAGKSLCYQLPAVLVEGVALVISPLISLMKDQVQALQARGISARRIDSSLSAEAVQQVFEEVRDGKVKLLYLAPERLMNETFIERLKKWKISFMAVDEAHCISEWGHNFRPEYLRLALVAKQVGIRKILALTATATPEVARDICQTFGIAKGDFVKTSFFRPNLHFLISPCPVEEKKDFLVKRLQGTAEASIVYVTLQNTAEEVATYLQRRGVNALAYHAGLPDEHRHAVQESFMSSEVPVIVATIAFGMGIDKSDIRAVYHYNLPKTLENYIQETGRAGRDGKVSRCEMLACEDDCIVLENFTYGDTPAPLALRQLMDHLLRQGEEFDISLYELSQATDIRSLVIETVLTHLELAGVLKPLGSYYASFQYRFLQPEQRVLSGHTPQRQAFLRRLFAAGSRGTKWTTLRPDETSEALGESKERIIKALNWLQEAGEIELKASHSRQRYRLCAAAEKRNPEKLTEEMQTLFSEREKRDLQRLALVLELAQQRQCLARWLLHYFGELLSEDCGACTCCLEKKQGVSGIGPRQLPRRAGHAIGAQEVARIAEVIREGHVALRGPRQLARFLCGISSPALSRARLSQHDAYGLLERVPFSEVLAQTQVMI